jgi:ribosomal protein L37AE/L43A
MSIADSMEDTYAIEDREDMDWSGDYDGTVCPNCHRERMLKCSNGKRRCEKCNHDPD